MSAVSSYELIRQALVNRDQVAAVYHGYYREMCPHVIGWKRAKDRKGRLGPREAHALFYQFEGESSSGLRPDGSADNWRCIRIDELENVTIRKGAWHTAPNHSRPQNCVGEIDAQVDD
jgi:hypothetical protein